jgi:plastocyanin
MRTSRLSFAAIGLAGIAASVTIAACGSSATDPALIGASPQTQSNSAPAPAPKTITMVVKADEEHARLGPEGTWHDAYLPADIAVRNGQRVTLHIYNYDEGEHSFAAPALGLNVSVAGGSEKAPKETTVTFTVSSPPGHYMWYCADPCDAWAMAHSGYMEGKLTVS